MLPRSAPSSSSLARKKTHATFSDPASPPRGFTALMTVVKPHCCQRTRLRPISFPPTHPRSVGLWRKHSCGKAGARPPRPPPPRGRVRSLFHLVCVCIDLIGLIISAVIGKAQRCIFLSAPSCPRGLPVISCQKESRLLWQAHKFYKGPFVVRNSDKNAGISFSLSPPSPAPLFPW